MHLKAPAQDNKKFQSQGAEMTDWLYLLTRFIDYISIERNFSPTTVGSYTRILRPFLLYLTAQQVNTCTDLHIRGYLYARREAGITPNSTSTYLVAIKSFFEYLVEEELILKNPCARIRLIRKESKIPTILTTEEVYRIINAPINYRYSFSSKIYQICYLVLCTTGLRRAELCNLDVGDVDITNRTLLVRHGKGNKDRLVPLLTPLPEILARYVANRKLDEPLFINRNHSRLQPKDLLTDLHKRIVICRIPKHVGLHSFRHYFATSILLNKGDLYDVSRLLGHSSVRVTERYIHFQAADLIASASKNPILARLTNQSPASDNIASRADTPRIPNTRLRIKGYVS